MVGGLPEGLVSNKKGVTKGIEEAIRLEAEDTLRLWRSMPSWPGPLVRRQLMLSFHSLLVRQNSHCRECWPETRELLLENRHEWASTRASKRCRN